jgi:hypothetical protein
MDEPKPINEHDPMNDMSAFENKLQQAFVRRPAPPGLKRRVVDQRNRRRTARLHGRAVLWQRLAACFVLAVALGGAFTWRHVEEQRKGEAARDQVLTALRITNHALNEVQARLAARNGNE